MISHTKLNIRQEIDPLLEPEVRGGLIGDDTALALSTAISTKRIADMMDMNLRISYGANYQERAQLMAESDALRALRRTREIPE